MTPGRRGVSCHVDNDDPRHWQFSRSSGLPIGYFDDGDLTYLFTRYRKRIALAVLVLALVGLAIIGDGSVAAW